MSIGRESSPVHSAVFRRSGGESWHLTGEQAGASFLRQYGIVRGWNPLVGWRKNLAAGSVPNPLATNDIRLFLRISGTNSPDRSSLVWVLPLTSMAKTIQ